MYSYDTRRYTNIDANNQHMDVSTNTELQALKDTLSM